MDWCNVHWYWVDAFCIGYGLKLGILIFDWFMSFLNSTLKCNFTSGHEGRAFEESATFNPGRKSDTDENFQPAHPTESYRICALRNANKYPMEISRILGRHKSTIYRELKALLPKLDWVWSFHLSRRLPFWSMTMAWFFTSCFSAVRVPFSSRGFPFPPLCSATGLTACKTPQTTLGAVL